VHLADELGKLAELRSQGQLSEEEFAAAKKRLLSASPSGPPPSLWNNEDRRRTDHVPIEEPTETKGRNSARTVKIGSSLLMIVGVVIVARAHRLAAS